MTAARSRADAARRVLLVEDNEDDVVLTQEAMLHEGIELDLVHVSNGKQCLEYLRQKGKYSGVPMPDLVVLDLNMPEMNGCEVLKTIVADERLSHLPVVVLTTSSSPVEVTDLYRLRCSSYLVKPVDFLEFARMLRQCFEYWFKVATLPRV